jgi:predicted AAA+ superfamily ATPase
MSSDSQILQKLVEYNEWWQKEKVPDELLKKFHRRDFYKLCEGLKHQKIISITGLRRVGKTSLIYQLIDYLINEEYVSPKRILFITLEHPLWKVLKVSLEDMLEIYTNSILNSPSSQLNPKDRIFVFLDEIHYLPDWELYLKILYDKQTPFKFIISGSSSLHLLRQSSESLVGRVQPQLVFPLKFLEYCRYKCYTAESELTKLDQFNFNFRTSLKTSIETNQLDPLFSFVRSEENYLYGIKSQLIPSLNEYVLKGGFPEYLNEDVRISRQQLITYIDLILFRDIPQIYPRRNVEELQKVLFWSSSTSPHATSYTNISKILEIKRDTVKEYLKILESVFLINRSELYSRSASKRLRAPIKIFIQDTGIQASYNNYPTELHMYPPDLLGKIIEGIVANHVKRLKFNLEGGLKSDIFYWSENRQEVDVVCDLFHSPLPIEVKYQNTIGNREQRGMKRFLLKNKTAPFGIIVSKESLEFLETERILVVPLWLFLLLI